MNAGGFCNYALQPTYFSFSDQTHTFEYTINSKPRPYLSRLSVLKGQANTFPALRIGQEHLHDIYSFFYLQPIQKIYRNIAACFAILSVKYLNKIKRKFVRTIIRIPDDLWNEITNILQNEKPENTTDRPIIPHRQVPDGILYVLGTGCQQKLLPKDYGSGSRCHRSFQ